MSSPVSRVTIHHEGAGSPTDSARGGGEGYTYWLGTSKFTYLRTPWDSWATKGYNHVSVDICFSGNRMDHPVTDNDLKILENICRDAKNRGFVVSNPGIYPHQATSQTACPGSNTMARWNDVVNAVKRGVGGGTSGSAPPPSSGGSYPPYPGTPLRNYIQGHGTRTWQQRMKDRGWNIMVDDKYGNQSENVCRQFQQEKHLQVDGVVGPQTWNAAWTAPIT